MTEIFSEIVDETGLDGPVQLVRISLGILRNIPDRTSRSLSLVTGLGSD